MLSSECWISSFPRTPEHQPYLHHPSVEQTDRAISPASVCTCSKSYTSLQHCNYILSTVGLIYKNLSSITVIALGAGMPICLKGIPEFFRDDCKHHLSLIYVLHLFILYILLQDSTWNTFAMTKTSGNLPVKVIKATDTDFRHRKLDNPIGCVYIAILIPN